MKYMVICISVQMVNFKQVEQMLVQIIRVLRL